MYYQIFKEQTSISFKTGDIPSEFRNKELIADISQNVRLMLVLPSPVDLTENVYLLLLIRVHDAWIDMYTKKNNRKSSTSQV